MSHGLLRPLSILLVSLGLMACAPILGQKIVVPEMPTARDQYVLAYDAYRHATAFLGDSDNRTQAINEAKAACQAVLRNFPDDSEYRPLAALLLGRAELIRNRFAAAASHYRKALDRFPDDPRVQQIGLYELGLSLDGAGRHTQAKEVYRLYIERFTDDPELADNPDAQIRLAEAVNRYRIIRSE